MPERKFRELFYRRRLRSVFSEIQFEVALKRRVLGVHFFIEANAGTEIPGIIL